jgi:hypothetical protein
MPDGIILIDSNWLFLTRLRNIMDDEILKEFKDKAVIDRNEILFHEQDTIQLIQRCREQNKKILGIETFILDPPYIQPMDFYDYTSLYYANFDPEQYFQKYHIKKYTDSGRWADAIQFVKDRIGRGWLFEIDYERY